MAAATYLIHFSEPFGHAKHYVGSTTRSVAERFAEHVAGQGANLTALAVQSGITLTLARTWDGDRAMETKLKYRGTVARTGVKHGMSRYCPTCRAARRS